MVEMSAIAFSRGGPIRRPYARSAATPDLPRFAVAGLAGTDCSICFGIAAPADFPNEIAPLLHAAPTQGMRDADTRQAPRRRSLEPMTGPQPEFAPIGSAPCIDNAELVRGMGLVAQ